MTDVRLIAAIGARGQLGLDGKLPWGKEIGDLPWFREQTMGGVILMGWRTARTVGALDGRDVWAWNERDDPRDSIPRFVADYPGRVIWIAGGARTYAAFAPFCMKFIITRVDYDGPADAWFDPAWLLKGPAP